MEEFFLLYIYKYKKIVEIIVSISYNLDPLVFAYVLVYEDADAYKYTHESALNTILKKNIK